MIKDPEGSSRMIKVMFKVLLIGLVYGLILTGFVLLISLFESMIVIGIFEAVFIYLALFTFEFLMNNDKFYRWLMRGKDDDE